MQRRGVQPDILVYTVLMSWYAAAARGSFDRLPYSYARAESTETVIEILDSMRADGVVANAQTLAALIAVAVQKRNHKLIDVRNSSSL